MSPAHTVTSLVSGGKKGVLIAEYDKDKDITRVVSHLSPHVALLETEGRLRLHDAQFLTRNMVR
jgi:hypothetical protein